MAFIKPRISGALFENERTTGPAFSGFIEIDGVKTPIVLWAKTSNKGNNYLQISEDKKKTANMQSQAPVTKSPFKYNEASRQGQSSGYPPRNNNDMDDDIPF